MDVDYEDLLKSAIKPYGLNPQTIIVEKELQPNSSHGDLHFKIRVNEKSFSARFMSNKRYEHSVFAELTDEVLAEQIQFCHYLRHSGIPFMKPWSTLDNKAFTYVKDKDWRFVLFEWIEGEHVTHCTEPISEKFGAMARKIHDISTNYVSEIFTKQSHISGSEQFLHMIRSELESSELTPTTIDLLQKYIALIEHHISEAKTDVFDYIIQSDLNPLNILWDDTGDIVGVVDFESITYTDRVEGIAWLIKWYSRTHGIASHAMSPELAKAVLRGYRVEEVLTPRDFQRLPALLWLSGCLNWNFTATTINLLKSNENLLLQEHLTKYFKRGDTLLSLI